MKSRRVQKKSDCKICTVQSSGSPHFLMEFEHFTVRKAESEKNCPGYLYIEPRRHIEIFTELNTDEYSEFGSVLEKSIRWIYEHFQPRKLYTVTVSEAVPHIHWHLVPRYSDQLKGFPYIQAALEGKLPEKNEN